MKYSTLYLFIYFNTLRARGHYRGEWVTFLIQHSKKEKKLGGYIGTMKKTNNKQRTVKEQKTDDLEMQSKTGSNTTRNQR